jgi:hypothetical protein
MDLDGLAALVRENGAATAKVHSRLDAIEASLSALSTELRNGQSGSTSPGRSRPSLSGPAAAGALSYSSPARAQAGAEEEGEEGTRGSFVAELPPPRRDRLSRVSNGVAVAVDSKGHAPWARRVSYVDAIASTGPGTTALEKAFPISRDVSQASPSADGDGDDDGDAEELPEGNGDGRSSPRSKAMWSKAAGGVLAVAKIEHSFNQSREARLKDFLTQARRPPARPRRPPPAGSPRPPDRPTHRTPTSRTCSPGSGRTIST